MAENPVTRFAVASITLTNGKSFQLVHDLDLAVWDRLVDKWSRTTKKPTATSLIIYIKDRRPYCICVTKQQFDEITAGKSSPATKAEWEAENFGRNE